MTETCEKKDMHTGFWCPMTKPMDTVPRRVFVSLAHCQQLKHSNDVPHNI